MKFLNRFIIFSLILCSVLAMLFIGVTVLLLFAPETAGLIFYYIVTVFISILGVYFFISSVAGLSISFLSSVKRDPWQGQSHERS